MRFYAAASFAAASSLLLMASEGAAETVDKSGYTLFNPTPADKMREFSTDRPDQTEGPFTVDAGRVQLEADLVNMTRNEVKEEGVKATSTSTAVMAIAVKVGLTSCVDMHVIHDGFVTNETKVEGAKSEKVKGGGDTTLRVKVNFWGNDGGDTAFGVIPFVKLPTAAKDLGYNRAVEYGVVLPLSLALPGDFGLGTMVEVDMMKNAADDKRHVELVASASLSRDLISSLGGYIELYTRKSLEKDAKQKSQFDVGLTLGIGDNAQLDTGVNIALNDAADDLNPFVGASIRF